MNILIILLILFIVIYSCVSWLLPALLAWLFKRKFHIKLKIGRIAVPKLILRDVSLSKDGYYIHIDEVSFRSSFFNSEINKLLSVVIKSIDITNNAEEKRSVVVETILKPLLSKQNSKTEGVTDDELSRLNILSRDLVNLSNQKLLDFRNKKLPPSLIMFAQFMGVHIFNATLRISNGSENAWSVHASASEIHADGAGGGPARALVFSANLVQANVEIVKSGGALAEAAFSVLIEGTVKAEEPLNVEKIHTVIGTPTLLIQDELYHFIKQRKKRSMAPECDIVEDYLSTLIPRLSPVIPKIFSLKVDETKMNCVDNITKTMFEISLQSTQVNSRFSAGAMGGAGVSDAPQVYVALQMDRLRLAASGDNLLFMDKLKLDAKLEKSILNLYLIVSTLSLLYVHARARRWYDAACTLLRRDGVCDVTPTTREGWLITALRRAGRTCGVAACAELSTARLRLSHARALSLACNGLKFKMDQMLDTREDGGRSWSAEVLVTSAWARLAGAGAGPDVEGAAPERRVHAWRSALLGVALVKWGEQRPNDSKIEAMVDSLRLEWSPEVAETVISLVDCLNDYRSARALPPAETPPEPQRLALTVSLEHINVFLILDDRACVMARIDAVSLERTHVKTVAAVSGLKMVEMVPYKENVHCQKSDEIASPFFHVKLARVEFVPSLERYSTLLHFHFIENVFFEWSPNLHLKITNFVRKFRSFRQDMAARRRTEVAKKVGRSRDWRVTFKCDTNLSLILSKENNMLFNTDDMIISYDHVVGLTIAWSRLRVIINGDEIIVVDEYCQTRAEDDPDVRIERSANEGFQLAWNKVWSVSVGVVRVAFPYKHRFAEAVQGDFVTLFKWIKLVHGIQKKPFTADSPLPSDLHIKIDELMIEMSDDPFEVKLRDNYELLEDEYKESQKRRAMLDAKVQELCKPPMFLPAGKVEELYAALRAKDAQIYVQRSRAAPPPRTRLVACVLTELRIIALADPSVHGAQRATARLREIDADSPWPEEGVEFSTLWCRAVGVWCGSWQLRLRDFPQPLLSMTRLRLWGTLLGAEEVPPPRAVRIVEVDQGEGWGRVQLERSMMPLKWYYDLCCEMTDYSYAFGPCWEPVIAHCNLAFDNVSRPSLDPSAPLAWWDKARLLLHGRLTVHAAKFTCLLHVSLDPYNTTEEMELTWTDLVLDWTNGKLGFLGELKVFVRTASKYDDCRVLRVPALRLGAKLGWLCVADPRDHFAVAPCAPTRLPEYSSNQEHDSYRAFRSQGLDVHLSMDTKPIEGDGPTLLLYGSTLRWFESLKLILSGTTRPTRRGRVFRNLRPRKPQLSRHYRNVSVSLQLHNLQVFYWSSSSMQRGIEALGVRVTCSSRHRLSLVAGSDGLLRRARAIWATLYTNCELGDVEVWLKTASQPPPPPADERDGDREERARTGCMEKCYCVSVRRVSYGREGGGPPAHRLAVHDLRGAWTKLNRDLAFALIDTYIKTQV